MDFASVKLKKVETRVADARQQDRAAQRDELAVLVERVRQMDLDAWYERFAEHTFRTVFVPITLDEGRAMVAAHKSKLLTLDPALPCVAQLEQAIAATRTGQAFVKLSSRSPKDATVAAARTKQLFAQYVPAQADDNDKLIALNRAHIEALAVRSASEALELLLRSERIYDDLELALESPARSQHLVVREWSSVALDGEFRGFVCGGQLTALSQYYVPCFFPSLQDEAHRNRVAQQCRDLVAQVRSLLPPNKNECAVVDFLVVGGSVKIIEMNPFNDYAGCGTSAALFDWKADADVLCGVAPFEFRYCKEVPQNVKALVGNDWREFFH